MRTSTFATEVEFADVNEWYTFSRSHGQRAMWDAIPSSDQDTVKAEAGTALEQARGADGRIRLHQQIRCTLATAPV